MSASQRYNRRRLLGAAAAGAAALTAGCASAASPPPPGSGNRLQVTDEKGRQRFLVDSHKPAVVSGGTTIPPSGRSGPDRATWLIFNGSDGSERGGLTADTNVSQMSLDWDIGEAVIVGADWGDGRSQAGITVNRRPGRIQDQSVPGAELGWDADNGARLTLSDSRGRPRIVLQVDRNDTPRIEVLDAGGRPVLRLP